MKKLLLGLLCVLIVGCASLTVQKEVGNCDRMVYNPTTSVPEKFPCLGETIIWDNIEFRLLAEAVEPTSKSIIGFFDFNGDCEVDAVGMYVMYEGVYYFADIISPIQAYAFIAEEEAASGQKLLREVPCLKKE